MPTEAATSISELDKNNPSSTAPAGEGDDHLRMLKDVLLASFPALDGLISNANGDQTAGNTNPPDAATFSRMFDEAFSAYKQRMPFGGIILWSGLESEIPTDWFLCDGTNSTPDLRNKFILAGDYSTSVYLVGQAGGEQWNTTGAFPLVDGLPSLDPSITVNTDTGTSNANLNQQTHEHPYLPPFYTLAYIQYRGT
jgi:hypothetical protein